MQEAATRIEARLQRSGVTLKSQVPQVVLAFTTLTPDGNVDVSNTLFASLGP